MRNELCHMPSQSKEWIFLGTWNINYATRGILGKMLFTSCNFLYSRVFNAFLSIQSTLHYLELFRSSKSLPNNKFRLTVKQQIFACRKFSWILRILRDSRNFHAREYYHKTVGVFTSHLHTNCLWPKFAKFSCRENFLFYSIYCSSILFCENLSA